MSYLSPRTQIGLPGHLLETDLVTYSDRCDAILPLGCVIGVSLKEAVVMPIKYPK
jgi:hypothetical protein